MCNFFKRWKIWRYVTGDKLKGCEESDWNCRRICLEIRWLDSDNHKIFTWIYSTTIHMIAIEFGKYKITKQVCDHLAKRYITPDLARKYKLKQELYAFCHSVGYSIFDFYSRMSLFGNMDQMGPKFWNIEDTKNMKASWHRSFTWVPCGLNIKFWICPSLCSPSWPIAFFDQCSQWASIRRDSQKILNHTYIYSNLRCNTCSEGQYSFLHLPNGKVDWSKVKRHYCPGMDHTKSKCPRLSTINDDIKHSATAVVDGTLGTSSVQPNSTQSTLTFTAVEVEDILARALAR